MTDHTKDQRQRLAVLEAENERLRRSLEQAYANYNQVSFASTERGKECERLGRELYERNNENYALRADLAAEIQKRWDGNEQSAPGEVVAWRGINELGEVVTEWIDGVPPERMVDLCGCPASFAGIQLAYSAQPAAHGKKEDQ